MVVIRYLDVGFKFCLVGTLLSIVPRERIHKGWGEQTFIQCRLTQDIPRHPKVLVPMYASADNDENLGKFTRFSLSNIDKEKGCHGRTRAMRPGSRVPGN